MTGTTFDGVCAPEPSQLDARLGSGAAATSERASLAVTNSGSALKRARARLVIVALLFIMAFTTVALKLIQISIQSAARDVTSLPVPDNTGVRVLTSRADIVDRNGVLLATSVAVQSVYADPKKVIDPIRAAHQLKTILSDIDEEETARRLASDRRFVWIRRNLRPTEVVAINRLGLPGISFQREERRIYTAGPVTAHVIGFTDIDNTGLMGVEQAFEKHLTGSTTPLTVSIDIRLQHILRREIQTALKEFHAIGGAGLIQDVQTGELLAMVSLPDFDPNQPSSVEVENRFNRVTLGNYEMGSTFKIFNTALALESGKIKTWDTFDAINPIVYGKFTINDFHGKHRFLTVAEVFQYSSNLGSARMAKLVGPDAQSDLMRRLGLLRPVPVELPEVAYPLVPHPWREINTMTIAYGHGLAVTPLHVAQAVSTVINGGILYPTTVIKRDPGLYIEGTRVVSKETSDQMRRLFRLVVTAGSGKNAAVPGYLVGGKTGTAEKTSGHGYNQNSRLSSFVGVFPMNAPRYQVLVIVDEPKGTHQTQGYATGGWVAAPTVARVIRQIGPLLGVAPVDEASPAIIAAMALDSRATRPPPSH